MEVSRISSFFLALESFYQQGLIHQSLSIGTISEPMMIFILSPPFFSFPPYHPSFPEKTQWRNRHHIESLSTIHKVAGDLQRGTGGSHLIQPALWHQRASSPHNPTLKSLFQTDISGQSSKNPLEISPCRRSIFRSPPSIWENRIFWFLAVWHRSEERSVKGEGRPDDAVGRGVQRIEAQGENGSCMLVRNRAMTEGLPRLVLASGGIGGVVQTERSGGWDKGER